MLIYHSIYYLMLLIGFIYLLMFFSFHPISNSSIFQVHLLLNLIFFALLNIYYNYLLLLCIFYLILFIKHLFYLNLTLIFFFLMLIISIICQYPYLYLKIQPRHLQVLSLFYQEGFIIYQS